MIVPSFRSLSALDRPANVIALVIPPFPDGKPFGPDTPVPEQLTSTIAGVVQSSGTCFFCSMRRGTCHGWGFVREPKWLLMPICRAGSS